MSDTESVTCGDCGDVLPVSYIREKSTEPCPNCGSTKKHVHLQFNEEAGLTIRERFRSKTNDVTLPSKKNPRIKFFSGDDQRKSDGKWMKKEQLVDAINDRYEETVIDPDTGEVVHHTREPLSQHRGHGSDKFKKK